MDSWKPYKLGEIITLKRGYDLPSRNREGGVFPIISSSGITDYHSQWKVDGAGVVTGRYGTLGLIHFSEEKFWPLNTTLYVKDFKGNDPRFIYYFLQILHLEEFNGAAAVPGLDRNVLHRITCYFPTSTDIQSRIASILKTYDEFIGINEERMRLLEKTAKELFKEWFVRLRFPEYKQATFVKGLPNGWTSTPIGKIIDFHIGGGWGNDSLDHIFSVPGYVIRGTDIPGIRIGRANLEIYRFHKASNLNSRELRDGDIIFETAGGSEGQPLGRTCYITQELLNSYGEKVIAASFCKQIRTSTIPSLYLYYFLNYLYDTGMIETYQVQSTGISNYQFESFLRFQQIILPPPKLMIAFHEQALLMQQQIAILGRQNSQLQEMKNRLLPRLISGKLALETVRVLHISRADVRPEHVKIDIRKNQNNQTPKAIIFFQRRVLAAYIIDHLKGESTFGHVKLMKLMYLCEHLAEIETASHYHRDAAGPYDNTMMRSIDNQLKKAQWFECIKDGQRHTYRPLQKKEEYKNWFTKYYNDKEAGILSLLRIFGKEKTEKAEMVATLYEAWRSQREVKKATTDDAILHEVLFNWHESKRRIERNRWQSCLQWMKEKGWIT